MVSNTFKKVMAAIVVASLAVFALAGCSSQSASSSSSAASSSAAASSASASSDDKVIKVGASPTPHAEILAQVQNQLESEGYTLQVIEYNDYIIPNTALEDGELDANYFQHITYLEDFNDENGTHLASVASIHFEPMGVYSQKITDLAELADGAVVAVPNDTTNEARALLLLEQEGLIELNPDAGITATKLDITSNPKNLVIQEVEAAQVPRTLPEVDIAIINGNYALNADLAIADAIATESAQGKAAEAYANVLVVKEGTEDEPKIQALVKALTSDAVAQFIKDNYNGAVVTVFE